MSSAGSLLAELFHRVDHFLLKIIKRTGLAQIKSFSRSVLRKILKVESSLTIGKELNSRRLATFAERIAEGDERRVFSELPIHRGGITERPLTPNPRDPSTISSRNVPVVRQTPRSKSKQMPSQQQEQKPVGEGDLNVLGGELEGCSCEPMTGWFRDGHCRTDRSDVGQHSVCCVMSEQFLNYSKAQGNDLSTPMPSFGFPGLRPGDHWCVCAPRWKQAYEDGMAPPVRLEATESTALEVIPLEVLKIHAHQGIS